MKLDEAIATMSGKCGGVIPLSTLRDAMDTAVAYIQASRELVEAGEKILLAHKSSNNGAVLCRQFELRLDEALANIKKLEG